MPQAGHTLGIDFGTSNSAAGFVQNGKIRLIQVEPGQCTLPTTFFFDFDTRETLIGEPANKALLDGDEGRFMRALKRVLGTSLMHEQRQILNERVTFVEIIARFLRQIKTRAEAETGLTFTRALSGRPVVFHCANPAKEQQAEDDLRSCYHAAGFEHADFLLEPEAAAIASGALHNSNEVLLIVDIGGGTSDFSLFRTGSNGIDILANHGVRIGGTDFDRSISIDHVMPLLGKGTVLRKAMGPGTSPVPNAIFNDLATWEKVPFLYTRQNQRVVAEMLQLAHAPDKLRRLATVLEDELGHELAFAVERGKIAANSDTENPVISLTQIERGLFTPLPPDQLTQSLQQHQQTLYKGALETLTLAGLPPAQVTKVIYVGGSSLMAMVTEAMTQAFPQAEHSFSKVFTAVANGLAIAASQQDK